MHTVKVFTIGDFQAVCIPDEYRFDTDEVFIIKSGTSSSSPLIRLWQAILG